MKIKILGHEDSRELEKIINDFIKNKKVIDIKYNTYTLFGGTSPNFSHNIYDRVMVMYEEVDS